MESGLEVRMAQEVRENRMRYPFPEGGYAPAYWFWVLLCLAAGAGIEQVFEIIWSWS